jgi:AcrR family transcriptional regulator
MTSTVKNTGRTRQPRTVREADIISAAHAIFSEKGYEKAAMNEIAKQAGVAEGTIYKYFSNKQDLLARVISRFYKQLIENTEANLVGVKGFENQLRVIISRHIQTFFEDLGLCRLLLQEVRPLHSYPHSEVYQLTSRYSEILLNTIEAAVANGAIREGISPQTVRDMIFGGLEHAGWNVLTAKKSTIDREQITHEIITITLSGLAPVATKPDAFENNLIRLDKLVTRLENNSTDH